MKKISKKQFKSLLDSVACSLMACRNLHVLDEDYASEVWQQLARTALLDYPQNDLAWWQMTANYLNDLSKSF